MLDSCSLIISRYLPFIQKAKLNIGSIESIQDWQVYEPLIMCNWASHLTLGACAVQNIISLPGVIKHVYAVKIYLHNDVLRHNKQIVVSLFHFLYNLADYNESIYKIYTLILFLNFLFIFFFVHVSAENTMMMVMMIIIINIIIISPHFFIMRLFYNFGVCVPFFQEKCCWFISFICTG